VKIATWNVNSLRVRLGHLTEWLSQSRPDVLALQETKIKDEDFPRDALEALGYHAVCSGQPGYNGVALLSRERPADTAAELDGFASEERRVLAATYGGLRVLNLYVPNGQRVGSEKYVYKLEWMAALREHVARELEQHPNLVLLGDFNVAPEDRDVHDPAAWEEKVLCSTPERAALGRIMALGLDDAFRLFDQPERAFSWWDYRAGAFRRNLGLRIDLILTSRTMSRACRACTIDPVPRGWERPSDHVPVVAEFDQF
jgi:exodeoxyribonuclease III